MQSIHVKFLGATNTKPPRLKATTYGGNSTTVSIHKLKADFLFQSEQVVEVAQMHMDKMGWSDTTQISGCGMLPDGTHAVTIKNKLI